MNTTIIIRPEVGNIIVLTFLIIYSEYCRRKQDRKKDHFAAFAAFAMGHNVFALITEFTVNSASVPPLVNDACHVVFFIFSVGFTYTYLRYILLNCIPVRKAKVILAAANILFALSVVSMFIFNISYLSGNGTNYSAGIGPTICFSTGLLMFIVSDVELLVHRKDLDFNVLLTLFPMSLVCIGLLVTQILVPEFFVTGTVLTIESIGVFFAIENPVGKFESRAMIDMSTGVKNKNCYERDVEKYTDKQYIGAVSAIVCDVNNLKTVNDRFGHLEGDVLIELSGREIRRAAPHATGIYRFGGDEFILLYKNVSRDVFESEAERLTENLKSVTDRRLHIPLSAAVGSAWAKEGESVRETVSRADQEMYLNKEAMKKASARTPDGERENG